MPSARTEATELSVAFGIPGMDPLEKHPESAIERGFEGTLPPEKYAAFRAEYPRDPELYGQLYSVGLFMAERHAPFEQTYSLQWTGLFHQASTTLVAKDLLVANPLVRVKTESNVVANLSPPNMMINPPGGTAPSTREDNWYLTTQPEAFRRLYEYVRGMRPELASLPGDIRSFKEQATRKDRKRLQHILKDVTKDEKYTFQKLYVDLCRRVAERSAEIFNQNLSRSLASGSHKAVLENVARWFFRLNAVRYVLCGIDRGEAFAVVIPDLTGWLREWDLVDVAAEADLSRGQSVVDFRVVCRHN